MRGRIINKQWKLLGASTLLDLRDRKRWSWGPSSTAHVRGTVNGATTSKRKEDPAQECEITTQKGLTEGTT